VHSHARTQVFQKFVGIPVFLLFLLHTATYTLILIPVVVCYFLLFAVIPLFLLFLVYEDSTYMLLFIPVICYLLLFLFSHYFFSVYPTCTLNIAISVPAKQVRDAA